MKLFRYLYLSHGDATGHTFNLRAEVFPAFLPLLPVQGEVKPSSSIPPNPTLHLLDQVLLNVQEKKEDKKTKQRSDLRGHFRQ